jgi:hypothetical protein
MHPELLRRPNSDEYFHYYDTYVRLVPDGRCLELLHEQVQTLTTVFSSVTEAQAMVVHAPYRWTLKQVVGHMIDTERVFADRLHRFASGEPQPQTGMDQELYVANHDYETPTLRSLVDELVLCRQANILLISRLQPTAWNRQGQASAHKVSVRALVWMMVGHVIHHLNIVQKRLGQTQ